MAKEKIKPIDEVIGELAPYECLFESKKYGHAFFYKGHQCSPTKWTHCAEAEKMVTAAKKDSEWAKLPPSILSRTLYNEVGIRYLHNYFMARPKPA